MRQSDDENELTDAETVLKKGNYKQVFVQRNLSIGMRIKFSFKRILEALAEDSLMVFTFCLTTISRLIYFTFPIFYAAWLLSFTPQFGAKQI